MSLGTWSATAEGLAFNQEAHLSRGEFDRLSQDVVAIEQCSTSVFFHALQHNKGAFDRLAAALDSRRRRDPSDRAFAPTGRVLQRRFLVTLANVLGAARAYFDATSDLLSTSFGGTAHLVEEFKASRHELYDSTPSFRFCEQLRNLMQHTASFPLRVEVASAGDGRIRHRLIARRDELLQSPFRWKAQVRADIEAGAEEVDIAQAIDTYWGCIVRIEHQRVVRQLSYERPAMERLLTAFQDANLPTDRPTVLLRTWADSEGEPRLEPRFGPAQRDLARFLELDAQGRLDEVIGTTEAPLPETAEVEAVGVTPEAEAILRAWLLGGPSEADRALRACVSSPQEAARAIAGLVNLAGVAMGQVETVLGLSALEMLAAFAGTAEDVG